MLARVLVALVLLAPATARAGEGGTWLRGKLASRRFALEAAPGEAPARAACRLSAYTASPATAGLQGSAGLLMCRGDAESSCAAPCRGGFERVLGTSVCLQRCPELGPSHLCPISRTCIAAEGAACPSALSDVPHACTSPDDNSLGSCAKQAYTAVLAAHRRELECANGLVFSAPDGGWRCAAGPDPQACAPGFANETRSQHAIGARCVQRCPAWLVDCGGACHMPGVPCSKQPEHLCPLAPLQSCSLAERSSLALQTACQAEGFHSLSGCPLALTMHGSCGGAKLQVVVGLRSRGFLAKVEAWWGPVVGTQPLPSTFDGPLLALRLSFTDSSEPTIFGNASHALASSPRVSFRLSPGELVVGARLWSSASAMDASLTPLLAGFSLATSERHTWSAGGTSDWGRVAGSEALGAALSAWPQHVELTGGELGVGAPVGAAAFSSDAGVHAFGFILLARTAAKQEL